MGVWVSELDGSRFILENATVDWTCKQVKLEIQLVKNLDWDTLDLHYKTQVLEDLKTLRSYGINTEDSLTLTIRDGVGIMELGGKKTRIRNAQPDWTVGQLKTAVSKVTDIPADCIQLLFRNGMLRDDKRLLSTYNMKAVMGSETALSALKQDVRVMGRDPPPAISAFPLDDHLTMWHCLVSGPNDTVYEGGTFRILLNIPNHYPMKPPQATFLSKVYHPNVYKNGNVCVDILGNNWQPQYRIRDVLVSLQALLGDPNPDSAANREAAEEFKTEPDKYREKVQEVIRISEAFQPREGAAAEKNYNIN